MKSILMLAGAAVAAAQFVPTGAKIEPSGYATIERAPHLPYPEEPPAREFSGAEPEWYARDNGISVEEARKRQAEQSAMFLEFNQLLTTLRMKEPRNFTSARMIHLPDWGYEFYFKRDPEATLAKYTRNPRYTARLARYTREELEALIKPWVERFTAEQIIGGWGSDDTHGTAEMMMSVTEVEYREIAARKSWEPVPDAIKLGFARPLSHPIIGPRAQPLLRAFATQDRSTVIQLLAAGHGRIVLRDGCLRLGSAKDAPLVMFHRETGIGVDDHGYLALTDRATGESRGRIGEWFSWAGPNGVPEKEADVVELQQTCGTSAVVNVGNPQSLAQSRARPHVIDEIARERRTSRKKAWQWLKQCWRRQESRNPDRVPDGLCR